MFEGLLQTLEVKSFEGGMTDNLENARPNQYYKCHNLLISPDGKSVYQRDGSEIFHATHNCLSSNQPVEDIFELEGFLFFRTGRKIYYLNIDTPAGFTELVGPVDSNKALPADGKLSVSFHRGHAYCTVDTGTGTHYSVRKIYVNSSNVPQVRTAGLPELGEQGHATYDIVQSYGAGGITSSPANYTMNYAVHYFYEYSAKVNGITTTFQDYGPVTHLVDVTSDVSPQSGTTNDIKYTWVALTNSADRMAHGWFEECWDLSNIKVYWYEQNSDDWFYAGVPGFAGNLPITAPISTATTVSLGDEYIPTMELYTNDGSFSNDPPPPALYSMVGPDNLGWYMNYKSYPHRARQAITNDIDSSPESFYVELPDGITGGGYVGYTPVMFTEHTTFRIEGTIDPQGNGVIRPRVIDTLEGCISHQGVVTMDHGLLFPSRNGICFTDGHRVINLTRTEFLSRYKTWTNTATKRSLISGQIDRLNRHAYWKMSESGTDPDFWLICDFSRGIQNAVFTTASITDNNIPAFLIRDSGEIIRGHDSGYVLKHTAGTLVDPKIDTTETTEANWDDQAIVYEFISPSYDFGSIKEEKWVTQITAEHDDTGELGVQISSRGNVTSYDFKNVDPYYYYPSMQVADPNQEWGNPDVSVNYDGNPKIRRHFHLRELRCRRKQVKFSNLKRLWYESADYAVAEYNLKTENASKLIINLSSGSWPSDVEGMWIAFEFEDYETQYQITSRVSNTKLELEVPDGDALVETGEAWKIYYINPGEKFKMFNYSIEYMYLNPSRDGSFAVGAGIDNGS